MRLTEVERFRREAAQIDRQSRWLDSLLWKHAKLVEVTRNTAIRASFSAGPLREGLYKELEDRMAKARAARGLLDGWNGGLRQILGLDFEREKK